jgi:hypothetical protein
MRTPRYAMKMTTAAAVLAVLICARPALAVDVVDDPVQIDERAAQLVQTSNSLCWEIFRYHQQQPDYQESYRAAKDIWSRAGELREALRAGPVETEALARQIAQMKETLDQLEQSLSQWGDGDRSLVPAGGGGQRTVVTSRTGVDLPFLGVHVGRPRYVVTDDGPPQFERRKLHPNSPGSSRSLERQFTAVRVALEYLEEDARLTGDATATGPARQSPDPDTTLGEPVKIAPRSTKKPGPTPARQ